MGSYISNGNIINQYTYAYIYIYIYTWSEIKYINNPHRSGRLPGADVFSPETARGEEPHLVYRPSLQGG